MNEFLQENPRRRGFEISMMILGGMVAVGALFNVNKEEVNTSDAISGLADMSHIDHETQTMIEQAGRAEGVNPTAVVNQTKTEFRDSAVQHAEAADREVVVVDSSSAVGGLATLSFTTGWLGARRRPDGNS